MSKIEQGQTERIKDINLRDKAVSLTPDILKILEETREGAMEEIEAANSLGTGMNCSKPEINEKIESNPWLKQKILEFLRYTVCNQDLLIEINETGDYSESTDKDGNTLLMLLLENEEYELANSLIKMGVNTHKINNAGKTTPSFIKGCNRPESKTILKAMIEHGGNPNDSIFDVKSEPMIVTYTRKSDLEMLKFLLEHGADINYSNGRWKMTPLLMAAQEGKKDVGIWLLENGADPNVKDSEGRDAWQIAISNVSNKVEANDLAISIYNISKYGYKKTFLKSLTMVKRVLFAAPKTPEWSDEPGPS